jgi:hypothetical protein
MIKLIDILKEIKWTSTNTTQPLKSDEPNFDKSNPKSTSARRPPLQNPSKWRLQQSINRPRPTKAGTDRTPRSTKFYKYLKVKAKNGEDNYGIVRDVRNNWNEVEAIRRQKEVGFNVNNENKDKPWYLIQFLNLDSTDPTSKGNYFNEKDLYNGKPTWYPEDELEDVPHSVYKKFLGKKDQWGLREND